jgi:hypothetical protein
VYFKIIIINNNKTMWLNMIYNAKKVMLPNPNFEPNGPNNPIETLQDALAPILTQSENGVKLN